MAKERYLVFIPAFHAAKTITRVMLKLKNLNSEFDVLVVDNHSNDGTLDVVKSNIARYNLKNYHLIRNIRNLGYGGSQKVAIWFGIYNGYDKLIIIHADDQYPVEAIPELIAHNSKTKAALTIGTRLKHKNVKKVMPKWRYFGNHVLSAMNRWAYGLNLDEFNSEFRIYNLEFMKKVDLDRFSSISHYTIESIIGIIAKKGVIDQIVISCAYPDDAHHPPFFELVAYGFYNVYRALKYKVFHT
jgi:glycosyltransferase involved in cell wall biosynthesis